MEDIEFTPRGFPVYKFKDQYDSACSLQKSSLATEQAVWLGLDNVKPEIMVTDARRLGVKLPPDVVNGWIPYEVPDEVLLSSRMHLTQDQVKELIPILQRFVETGEIQES